VSARPGGVAVEGGLPDVPSDARLVERIQAEIAADGPMTFARFMELALYDAEAGYYSQPAARPTRGGDFLTAPELHPIFGRALARPVVDVWRRLGRPDAFTIREFGAGSGALAVPLLRQVAVDEPALARTVRYQPIEHNGHRRDELRAAVERAGFAVAEPDGTRSMQGVVLANEFLDALPVHRVEGAPDVPGGIRELYVDVGTSGFREVGGPPSTPALAARLAAEDVTLPAGYRTEVRLADAAWIRDVGRDLRTGAVIVLDYALPAGDLYGPHRAAGSLLAYLGHRAHGDPFRAVGRQDLTAHVDATAIRNTARESGLEVLGETSQAEFLLGSGLEELVDEVRTHPATNLADWAAARSAVARLLDPRALGGFRVIVLGRGLPVEPPLAGLGFRLSGRT
jgi:SAM-dependent MidA family methyltransferase